MIELPHPYRAATPDDATAMAELVNMAGEGLPLYLWTQMAGDGQTGWDVGRDRARRESGSFSYRNAVVRTDGEAVVASLVGYPLADSPEASDYDDMPAMFVPLQQLEDRVPGTWYINVLATYPEHRGRGYGAELIAIAERAARDAGKQGLSIIVSDANTEARRLYQRMGCVERDRRPMVKERWENPGRDWVLLVKTF